MIKSNLGNKLTSPQKESKKITLNELKQVVRKIIKEESEMTNLETLVLNIISDGDEWDGVPTESIGNIRDNSGLSTKTLRGVLSSLLQKGLISQGEFPNGMTAFSIK